MTEEEKMIRGMIYDSSDKVLAMKRTKMCIRDRLHYVIYHLSAHYSEINGILYQLHISKSVAEFVKHSGEETFDFRFSFSACPKGSAAVITCLNLLYHLRNQSRRVL